MILYHVSPSAAPLTHFSAFTRFGTPQAALERAVSADFAGAVPVFHEVRLRSTLPLCIDAIDADVSQDRYGLLQLLDVLHYNEEILSAVERNAIVQSAGEDARDERAGFAHLARTLLNKGFDSIVYEGGGASRSNYWINIAPRQVAILRRMSYAEMSALAARTIAPMLVD